jgi:hypothetical protein
LKGELGLLGTLISTSQVCPVDRSTLDPVGVISDQAWEALIMEAVYCQAFAEKQCPFSQRDNHHGWQQRPQVQMFDVCNFRLSQDSELKESAPTGD